MDCLYKDYETLLREYVEEQLSTMDIALRHGVKKATIQYWLNKHKIPMRNSRTSRLLAHKRHPQTWTKNKVIVKCSHCGKEKEVWPYRYKRSEHFYCSKNCKAKHWSEIYSGEEAHNWKGGKWKETSDMREWPVYQRVRDEIRERDNWTCQLCGCRSNIIAHHIIAVRDNPDLVFEPTNLISLCSKCHTEKVNNHEKDYEQLFTDIVAKTVNCWDTLRASIPQRS